jgi:hypothetical protein
VNVEGRRHEAGATWMDDLFEAEKEAAQAAEADAPGQGMPLAARMRPRTLAEFVGQDHILGEGKLLRRAIEADRFTSLIFYGPPGVGKTSLAKVISHQTKSRFVNPAGRAAAAHRARHRAVHRGDHAQSLFLHQQPAGLAFPGIPARAAHERRPGAPRAHGARGRGTRPGRKVSPAAATATPASC